MSSSRLFWLFGGATGVVVASATGLSACSSSSSSNPGTVDSGMAAMGDTGTSADTGEVADSGTASDTSTAGDTGGSGGDSGTCENPPALFPETMAGVYCPFSAVDGGSNLTCAAGQHCCETPSGSSSPSTCVAAGTACPVANSIDWQCEAPIDCASAAGHLCCGNGTAMSVSSCGNTWTEWTGFTGTTCATSCPNPGFVVCEQPSDCTGDAGTTCSKSKSNGNDFGYCTP